MNSKTKVLVVDDDVVSRMVLMHMIDACGAFDILEAEDGADAWEQLEGGLRPAILFCDLRMPRLSGMELLALVKADALLSGVPFVLVSSASEHATVEQALGLGAAGYVVKPFDAPQVRTHLAPLMNLAPAAGSSADAQADNPRATMARLGIDAERLVVYLGGLHSQVTAAGAEIAALVKLGLHGDARQRLERLQTGCTTLGLRGAADAFLSLPPGALDPARVEAVLALAAAAALRQSAAVRHLQGAA